MDSLISEIGLDTEPKTAYSIFFISDRDNSSMLGAPHQYMAALWLSRQGYEIRTLHEKNGSEQGIKFEDALGHFLDFLRLRRGPITKFMLHFGFFLKILRIRLAAKKKMLFYAQGHVVCPAAWLALLGVPAARKIYHTQDYLEPGRHPIWAFFERNFARRAGTVLSNEVSRARFMASSYRLRAIPLVVPTALPSFWIQAQGEEPDRREALRQRGIPCESEDRLVLHQGPFIGENRCGHTILDAFAALPKNYLLTFTGYNEAHLPRQVLAEIARSPAMKGVAALPTTLRAWIRLEIEAQPSLKGRVFLLDEMPYPELLRMTRLFDMGLLLYPDDGVGNFYQAPGRLTEYIGSGVPIVTSRFPGLELLVLKHGLGRVGDPTSPKEIADAILSIGAMTRDELRQNGLRLRKVFEEQLCYEHRASVLENAVRNAGLDHIQMV